ncbi:MAG: single-stranded DNA-binding protein [Proteobacteria bacterium]|nr:single-stranded DNA-binding protein [Pseudomonadota bacterium]
MRGINRVTIIGRLGRDPELRVGAKTGKKVATISLATNRAFKKDGEWHEATDWHRVKCFDRLAEQVVERLHKGEVAGVIGTLTYDKWTDASGNARVAAIVKADQVEFMSPRRVGAFPGVQPATAHPEAVQAHA